MRLPLWGGRLNAPTSYKKTLLSFERSALLFNYTFVNRNLIQVP